jgi:hypothetical protein
MVQPHDRVRVGRNANITISAPMCLHCNMCPWHAVGFHRVSVMFRLSEHWFCAVYVVGGGTAG